MKKLVVFLFILLFIFKQNSAQTGKPYFIESWKDSVKAVQNGQQYTLFFVIKKYGIQTKDNKNLCLWTVSIPKQKKKVLAKFGALQIVDIQDRDNYRKSKKEKELTVCWQADPLLINSKEYVIAVFESCLLLYNVTMINTSDLSDDALQNYLIAQNKNIFNFGNYQEQKSSLDANFENYTEKYKKINIEMTPIIGGNFQMGNNYGKKREKPVHTVQVDDFLMSKYEITNAQFAIFLNDYGSDEDDKGHKMIYYERYGIEKQGNKWIPQSGYENYPVVWVTWYGANEFCQWLSQKTGKKYQLPTEAQREYAAGGGSLHQKWAGTNSERMLALYAWYEANSDKKTHQVGGKFPNLFGLYDMTGNVWEWCSDWSNADYYQNSPKINPSGPATGEYRSLRGGDWGADAEHSMITYRNDNSPDNDWDGIGFRIVCITK